MILLPYESYYLITPLTKSEIVKRLLENTDPKSPVFFNWKNKSSKPYEGVISDNGFKIARRIEYRNSFLPIIH